MLKMFCSIFKIANQDLCSTMKIKIVNNNKMLIKKDNLGPCYKVLIFIQAIVINSRDFYIYAKIISNLQS